MDLMVTNTAGKKDAVLTMAIAAMTVVLFKFLINGLTVTVVGDVVLSFGTVDAGSIGALLTPTLGAYVARRYTEQKFNVDSNNNGVIDPEEKGS